MKRVKSLLAVLLALIMMVSILPLNVFAAEVESDTTEDVITTVEETIPQQSAAPVDDTADETGETADQQPAPAEDEGQQPAADAAMPATLAGDVAVAAARDTSSDGFYKILMLDCGRKYFSADWIKALITEMAAAGYNQLTLAFGNDGLRFLLDDMSFTANGTTYDHATVVSKVEAGNKAQNSSGDGRWLTQTEMDGIISYANEKDIEIVPLLNLPGHANAILDIVDDQYNASGSNNTLDVANRNQAIDFGYALFVKYVDYFASKGCNFFNFGADEYANDASGTFSFSRLDSTQYQQFVSFINKLASYIKVKGMTPRAFNDGLYYNNQTASIDTSIQCCYWSSGWGSYSVAAASTIANKGHGMINTNGDYYYVLGKNDTFDSGYSSASGFSNTTFMGSTISKPVGSMFCIWCDYPNAETETVVAQKTRLVLRAMAARMNSESIDTISTDVVVGGFNADGSINTASVDTGDSSTGNTGTGNETTGKTVDVTLEVGGTKTFENVTADVGNYITGNDTYIAVAEVATTTTPGTTTYERVTELTAGTYYVSTSASATNPSVELTLEAAGDGTYYLKNSSGDYIYPNGSCFGFWSYEVKTGEEKQPITVEKSGNGYTFSRKVTGGYIGGGETKDVYLTLSGSSFGATGDSTTLYLYKEKTTPGTTSYNLTITGIGEGTTSVVVGDATYTITVTAPTELVDKTIYSGESFAPTGTDITITSGNDIVSLVDGKIVAGTTEGTATVTSVVKNAGGYVTKHYTYNVAVRTEDLSNVTPLSIEYWITNGRVQAPKGSTSTLYSVTASDAYGEDGIAVTDFIPATGNKIDETNTLDYWRCRLLDTTKSNTIGDGTTKTEAQTGDSKDDETVSGTGFTKVRYYGGAWSVYTENNEWVTVEDKHQLVAYYLEILNIATELKVNAADWGKVANGSATNNYLPSSAYCTVSIQVVYEDGTTNPASTNAQDLRSKTMAYGYWPDRGSRGVGTLYLTGLEGYQIYKVEAETGAVTANVTGDYGTFTATSFTWDDNAMTVYEGDPVDSYVIHNDAGSPSKEGFYENLQWDENKEAILITVYVKAKATEDSLKVVYFDEKFNDELYTYNIPVESGHNFTNNIVNNSGVTTPWAEIPSFTTSTTRKDVSGYGIVNTLEVTQWFQTDLTKVPEAVGKYHSDLYNYTGSELKDDGKTLYLYYTINTETLKPNFVIDFGLPITFGLDQLVSNVGTVDEVVSTNARYGTVTYNETTTSFTYTPTQILPNVDVLTITLTIAGTTTTTNVGVTPATSVFYEESFLSREGSWTENGTKVTSNQTTEVLGDHTNNYGYDSAYSGVSSGSYIQSRTKGDKATFTFTGTGFQLYANSTSNSGIVTVYRAGQVNKVYMIGTQLSGGTTGATNQQSGGTYNSLPIISETALPYGSYTVEITHTNNDSPVMIDGVRILGTMQDSTIYEADLEDSPNFYELRDYVLKAIGVESGASDYGTVKDMAGQVYNGNSIGEDSAIVIDVNAFSHQNVTKYAQDLLDNGPKNELYLYGGQTLVFKVNTNRVMQLGLKAPTGSANFTLTVDGAKKELSSLTSCVDMFYEIAGKADTSTEHTVTITVSNGLLSVTLLKICDDPSAAFTALTQEDIEGALMGIYGISGEETTEPVDPVEPTDPVDPVDPVDPEPDEPDQPETLTTTLNITFVNLFGRRVGTETLEYELPVDGSVTVTGTTIRVAAPAHRTALWLFPVTLDAGASKTIIVPVL